MTDSPGADVVYDSQIQPFFQSVLKTVSDVNGALDFLAELWQRPDAQDLVLCVIGIYPTSSAGSWSTDGTNISTGLPGFPFGSGGGVLNMYSVNEVRNFRIQAATGGTVTFVARAYR